MCKIKKKQKVTVLVILMFPLTFTVVKSADFHRATQYDVELGPTTFPVQRAALTINAAK